jgi:rSAM/selenodomain-associated transferase 1
MAPFRVSTDSVDIAIFARAPQPGAAKTRLIPALGATGAARLQRRLILNALHNAMRIESGRITLWCAPDTQHHFFRALHAHCGVNVCSQLGTDLGARMAHAFAVHGSPMLLIGTDCPALQTAHLAMAADLLRDGHDAVFIPAEDGGYVLVGLRQAQPRLFENIDWGSGQVMAQTRDRLAGLDLRWAEPLTLWDVDRPADLARLATLEDFSEWAS